MKIVLLFLSSFLFLLSKAQTDTIPPIITMNGPDTVWHIVFTNYIDAGATAFDLNDGNVAVTKSGVVNDSITGIYAIQYNSEDSSRNQAIPKKRIIVVKDTTKPEIKLLGPNPLYYCKSANGTVIEPGWIATDNYDTGLSVSRVSFIPNANNTSIYYITYYAFDKSGNVDSARRIVVETSNCAYGRGFFDTNQNCNFDTPEKTNSQFKLLFKNLATSVTTTIFPDIEGEFGVGPNLDFGTYQVKVLSLKNYLKLACAVDSFTYIHTATSTAVSDIPFLDTLFNDVSVNLSIYQNHRWNFENNVYLNIRNFGTLNSKISPIEFNFPSAVTIKSTNPTYDSIANNKIYWHLDTFISHHPEYFSINYVADTAKFHLNDTITFLINAICSNVDIDTLNNKIIVKKRVVSSFDPNEKYCSQPIVLKQGTTDFNYTVVFQNTGNAEAYEVVVIDTIDSRFDISTFSITESSHLLRSSIQNNILTVRFVEINLPDSHSNEPKSHGYFSYNVKLKKPLSLNEEIKNTAYIYFDKNPAIITNTTTNRYILSGITNSTDYQLGVYPNPASTLVSFQNPEHEGALLLDLIGNVLLVTKNSSLDVSHLPSGMYIIKVGQRAAKFIKE